MPSPNKEEKAKALFESRFLSVILMVCLLLMCALFIVVIHQIFGPIYATRVSIDLAAGAGGGILLTVLLLLLVKQKQMGRNILLYLVSAVLFGSLLIALILKFSIADPERSSWAFIDASAIGLGITSGISLMYLLLAIFNSSLVLHEKAQKDEREEMKNEKEEKKDNSEQHIQEKKQKDNQTGEIHSQAKEAQTELTRAAQKEKENMK